MVQTVLHDGGRGADQRNNETVAVPPTRTRSLSDEDREAGVEHLIYEMRINARDPGVARRVYDDARERAGQGAVGKPEAVIVLNDECRLAAVPGCSPNRTFEVFKRPSAPLLLDCGLVRDLRFNSWKIRVGQHPWLFIKLN